MLTSKQFLVCTRFAQYSFAHGLHMFAHLRCLHKVCTPKYWFAPSLHSYSQGPPLVAQGAIRSAHTTRTPAPLSARPSCNGAKPTSPWGRTRTLARLLPPGLGASATGECTPPARIVARALPRGSTREPIGPHARTPQGPPPAPGPCALPGRILGTIRG